MQQAVKTQAGALQGEARAGERLTLAGILDWLVADQLVGAQAADDLKKERRYYRGALHPLVIIADQKWRSATPPAKPLTLEALTEWLAKRVGLDYFHIDPLKIDFAAVTDVVSSAYATRFRILPVAVTSKEATIATAEPQVREWEAELARIIKREIRRVIANPLDIERIGDHAPDLPLDDARELRFPLAHLRLGGSDGRFLARHRDRQDAKARRIRRAHHVGHRGEIDLQGVDVEVVEADALRQPLGQRFERQRLGGRRGAAPFLVGDDHQRVQSAAVVAALFFQIVGRLRADQLVGDQPIENAGEGEPLACARLPLQCSRLRLNRLLHRRKTIPERICRHSRFGPPPVT